MTLDRQGSGLIFLVSLPRSGSTMLQKVLSSNQDVHTTSEPWVALHPVYALREHGHSSEYNSQLAYRALHIFLGDLERGEETYYESLRLMLSHIYGTVLRQSKKKYFLDKTPRYYEIIPELHRLFPGAKLILLLRNPMAVLHSRINLLPDRKGGKGLKELNLYERDLLYGPGKLLDGIEVLGDNCLVLKYEDFILHPDSELETLCKYLGITYSASMLEYNKGSPQVMKFGDPVKVYKNKRPTVEYRDKWVESMAGRPQLWRMFSEYREFLGDDLISALGYSPSGIKNILDETKPTKSKLFFTKSLDSFVRLLNENK